MATNHLSKDYLVMKGNGNRADCGKAMGELLETLKRLKVNLSDEISYTMRLMSDMEDFIDELFDYESDELDKLAENIFPIIYLRLDMDEHLFEEQQISELMSKFDCVLIKEWQSLI